MHVARVVVGAEVALQQLVDAVLDEERVDDGAHAHARQPVPARLAAPRPLAVTQVVHDQVPPRHLSPGTSTREHVQVEVEIHHVLRSLGTSRSLLMETFGIKVFGGTSYSTCGV